MRTLPALVLVLAACGGAPKQPQPKAIGNTASPPKEEPTQTAGILGVLVCDDGGDGYGGSSYGGVGYGCVTSGAFASLTGTGDLGSGFDDANIYGGLIGDGTTYGGFGYGRGGYGVGGGGTGQGTVGTGRYGTIGHGSGTGSGYGVGGGHTGDAKGPTVRIGTPTAKGDLDKAIIRRYIKRNIEAIRLCYETELANEPTLAGTVTTKFTIEPSGNVTHSTATGVNAAVADCIAALIATIEFPKPKGGGKVNVSYPFTFVAAEE